MALLLKRLEYFNPTTATSFTYFNLGTNMQSPFRIVIVGGEIAGLSAVSLYWIEGFACNRQMLVLSGLNSSLCSRATGCASCAHYIDIYRLAELVKSVLVPTLAPILSHSVSFCVISISIPNRHSLDRERGARHSLAS